jgi:hypothetical protein
MTGCANNKLNVQKSSLELEKGLYFGHEGKLISLIVYVEIGETALVEAYQPVKGEIFEIEREILLPSNESKNKVFSGKTMGLLVSEDSVYLVQTSTNSKIWNKKILLRRDQSKEQERSRHRNKALSFLDRKRLSLLLTAEIINTDQIPPRYQALKNETYPLDFPSQLMVRIEQDILTCQNKYKVKDLAENFSSDAFLAEYQEIRNKIIADVLAQ